MEWIIMSDELEHSGKRGMHWGERNYQRKDGTWTPLGLRLRRAREGTSASKRKPSGDAQKRAERKNEIKNLQSKAELDNAKTAYKINKAQNKSAVQTAKAGAASIGNKIKDATKKAVEAHKEKKREESVEDIVRSGDMNKILSSKTKLTEDELRTAVNRLRLEQDLKDVSAREKARGQETIKRFAGAVNGVAKFTKNGIAIYNNIATVMNTFLGKDLKTIGGNNNPTRNTNRQRDNDDNDVTHGNDNDVTRANDNDNSRSGSSHGGGNNNNNPPSNGGNNRSDSSRSSSSGNSGSTIRPNEAVNERARQRAAEANEQRRQTEAQQRAQEGFRAWRENSAPPRSVVSGTGTSRRQAESAVDRHARERASAVDAESINVVENELMPLINDARFRRRD